MIVRGTVYEGENCKISPTTVIDVDNLHLGNNVTIGPNTVIKGGEVHLGDNSFVDEFVRMNTNYFRAGEDSTLRGFSRIEGREVKGGHRFYLNYRSKVGGGGAFDYNAYLNADNWLHLGEGAELNTARGIKIGREVAIGPASKAYTHGIWGPLWEGRPEKWAPINIEDYAWMTYARINPGVTIGHDSVIATMSLVDVDVPPGSHVMGIPISKFRDKWRLNQYPRKISDEEKQKIIEDIKDMAEKRLMHEKGINHKLDVRKVDEDIYDVEGVKFHMSLPRKIEGTLTEDTRAPVKMFIDQARRKTLRFDYKVGKDGRFVPYPNIEK